MDKWKYYDVCHRRHVFCNPMSVEKFERLCGLFELKPKSRVLDIASGKGEFLVRLAELYDISGVGVDISPYCIRDSLEKKQQRVPNADLRFIEMDAVEYKPDSPESFDLAMCVGASWIYKGYLGTLRALKDMTKQGGLIVVGEPYWLREPSEEYLRADNLRRDEFGTHYENVKTGEAEGLTCLYTVVSDLDDWDHYETLHWWAIEEYVRTHPDDPDNKELLEQSRRDKETYLMWGRDTLGWAIYTYRKT